MAGDERAARAVCLTPGTRGGLTGSERLNFAYPAGFTESQHSAPFTGRILAKNGRSAAAGKTGAWLLLGLFFIVAAR